MKRPATNHARRKATEGRKAPEIKVTRASDRPQIKASRGPGGPARRRKVAQPTARRTDDRRVAETRRQSLSSIGSMPAPRAKRPKRAAPAVPGAAPKRRPTSSRQPASSRRATRAGGGSVRAVAVGASGGAAAGAARVVAEVARPVGAVTRPVLRVVSGGLEALPQAAGRATPVARGRLLIVVAGLLAAGLIYINVGRLEYGDGYSKYSARAQDLQRENTVLRSRIAKLNTAERIKRYAQRQGMTVPKPEQYRYLRSRRGDAVKASRGLSAPLSQARPGDSAPTVETGASDSVASTPVEPAPVHEAGL